MHLTAALQTTATGSFVALCVEHDLVAVGADRDDAVRALKSMAVVAIRYAGALPPPPPKLVLDRFTGGRVPFTLEIK
jgi:hypothetical protein